jgi:hypothetical protein
VNKIFLQYFLKIWLNFAGCAALPKVMMLMVNEVAGIYTVQDESFLSPGYVNFVFFVK